VICVSTAKVDFPLLEYRRGQRFTCRQASTQRAEAPRALPERMNHLAVKGGNAEEDRCLRPFEDVEREVCRRSLRLQNGGCAHPERKCHPAAETERKEKFAGAEHDVIGLDAGDLVSIALARHHHVAMSMHDALREPGRA